MFTNEYNILLARRDFKPPLLSAVSAASFRNVEFHHCDSSSDIFCKSSFIAAGVKCRGHYSFPVLHSVKNI